MNRTPIPSRSARRGTTPAAARARQLDLFRPLGDEVVERLREIEVDPPGLAGIDDEDGIGLAKFVTGKSSTVRVTATAAGKLDAWIDWNHDGTFGEDELVADALSVRDGTISFKVAVPENNILGTTFARFRVSEEGSLDPTGRALSGEVEDYIITVAGK